MKSLFHLFIIGILIFSSYLELKAQTSKFIIDSSLQNPWVYYAEKLCFTSDGGILLYRKISNPNFPDTRILLKTDSNFQFSWAKEIQNLPSNAEISEIGNLPGGAGYYLLGDFYNNFQSNFIAKLDLSGNILNSKSYVFGVSTASYLPSSLKFFSSGDMLLFSSDFTNMRCAVIDSSGNPINAFAFAGDSGSLKSPGMNSRVLGDSLILFTAKNDSSPVLGILSKTGNIQWAKNYHYSGLYEQPRALEYLHDSCIIIGGSFVDYNTSSSGSFLMKVDKNGNFIWKKNYASSLFTAFTIAQLIEKPNGNLICKDLFDGIFMETDAHGNVIAAKLVDGNNSKATITENGIAIVCNKFNSSNSQYNPSIHQTPLNLSNHCLFVDYYGMNTVTINNLPNVQSGIYKTTLVGSSVNLSMNTSTYSSTYNLQEVCNVNGITEEYSDKLLSIYPVPADLELNITFNSNEIINSQYSIFNIQGKKIKTGNFCTHHSKFTLPLDEFENGTYFMSITMNNNSTVPVKFMVLHP